MDALLPFVTDFGNFQIPIIITFIGILLLGRQRSIATILILGVGLAMNDVLTNLLKDAIARPRPCQELDQVRLLLGCGRHFSLPSGHAASIFMVAILVSFRHRGAAYFLLPLAALIGYSRIYVGAHYPADVLAGAIVGLACASMVRYGIEPLKPSRWDQLFSRALNHRDRIMGKIIRRGVPPESDHQ